MQRWWILAATAAGGVALAALLIAVTRTPQTSDPGEVAASTGGAATAAATQRGAVPTAAMPSEPTAAPDDVGTPEPPSADPADADPAPVAARDLPADKQMINEADAALVAGDWSRADALLVAVIDDPETSEPIRAFAQYKRASALVGLEREDEARALLQQVAQAEIGEGAQARWLREQAQRDLAEME